MQIAKAAMLKPHKSPQKATTYIQPQGTQRVDFIFCTLRIKWSQDSSGGIVTCYTLDSLGLNPGVGVRFSAPVQTSSEAHPASYTMGTGSLLGVKWPGRGADHPAHLALRLRTSRAIAILPLWACVA